jgi:hypothetical protein
VAIVSCSSSDAEIPKTKEYFKNINRTIEDVPLKKELNSLANNFIITMLSEYKACQQVCQEKCRLSITINNDIGGHISTRINNKSLDFSVMNDPMIIISPYLTPGVDKITDVKKSGIQVEGRISYVIQVIEKLEIDPYPKNPEPKKKKEVKEKKEEEAPTEISWERFRQNYPSVTKFVGILIIIFFGLVVIIVMVELFLRLRDGDLTRINKNQYKERRWKI